MPKISAGLLMYRFHDNLLQVFLVHHGGPFWAKKDLAAWTIPKGEAKPDEDPLQTAMREFEEETGIRPSGSFVPISPVRAANKIVMAWAFQGDCDPTVIRSNTFEMEWPPRSGRKKSFPEIDRAAWFDLETAKLKIHKGQVGILEEIGRLFLRNP